MRPRGCQAVLAVVLTVLSFRYTNGAQCELRDEWNRHWFYGYSSNQALLNYFNDTMVITDLTVVGGQIDESNLAVATCEESEIYTYTDYYYNDEDQPREIDFNTVIAYKQNEDNKRYCFDGIDRGNLILYKESDPVTRAGGYTADLCYGLLSDVNEWRALIKYELNGANNLQFLNTISDIPNGRFYFTYTNGDNTEHCTPADSSSTIQITPTRMTIRSCETDNTYERPLNTELVVVGTFQDWELDADISLLISGMVVLGYPDNTAPLGYYFYIARYAVDRDGSRLTIRFLTDNKDRPIGELREDNQPDLANTMFFHVYSKECENSRCTNNATCMPRFPDYKCNCPDGFTGKNCEDDKNECLLTISPCSNNGVCIDMLDSYECDCNPGWGGTICDERDPCNPDPCISGECLVDGQEYFCLCDDDFYGQHCDLYDYCVDPDICDNGGVCHLLPDQADYQCVCPIQWTGKHCDEPNDQPTGPVVTGSCLTHDDCEHDGVCEEFRCNCVGFWTGARCQETAIWFIASIALIALLALLLIIILIVCCCCCYGGSMADRGGSGAYQGHTYQNDYATMEAKSLDGIGPAPGTVQFNMVPPQSATYNSVLTSTR